MYEREIHWLSAFAVLVYLTNLDAAVKLHWLQLTFLSVSGSLCVANFYKKNTISDTHDHLFQIQASMRSWWLINYILLRSGIEWIRRGVWKSESKKQFTLESRGKGNYRERQRTPFRVNIKSQWLFIFLHGEFPRKLLWAKRKLLSGQSKHRNGVSAMPHSVIIVFFNERVFASRAKTSTAETPVGPTYQLDLPTRNPRVFQFQ